MTAHLGDGDAVAVDHRCSPVMAMVGVDLQAMIEELLGKETGLCRGRGGHMHLFDASRLAASSGIVGAAGFTDNWYVAGGLHDANGSPTQLGLDLRGGARIVYAFDFQKALGDGAGGDLTGDLAIEDGTGSDQLFGDCSADVPCTGELAPLCLLLPDSDNIGVSIRIEEEEERAPHAKRASRRARAPRASRASERAA